MGGGGRIADQQVKVNRQHRQQQGPGPGPQMPFPFRGEAAPGRGSQKNEGPAPLDRG